MSLGETRQFTRPACDAWQFGDLTVELALLEVRELRKLICPNHVSFRDADRAHIFDHNILTPQTTLPLK